MKLNKMMMAPYIKRWGIVATTREQSIAEHSFMVAILSGEFYAYLLNDEHELDHNVVRELYELAIWHDMPEIVTGDINSVFKEAMGWSTDKDFAICPPLEYATEAQTHYWQEWIVKICDVVEALRFIRLHGVSCADTRRVRKYLRAKLNNLLLAAESVHPQFEWSIATARLMEDIQE